MVIAAHLFQGSKRLVEQGGQFLGILLVSSISKACFHIEEPVVNQISSEEAGNAIETRLHDREKTQTTSFVPNRISLMIEARFLVGFLAAACSSSL